MTEDQGGTEKKEKKSLFFFFLSFFSLFLFFFIDLGVGWGGEADVCFVLFCFVLLASVLEGLGEPRLHLHSCL